MTLSGEEVLPLKGMGVSQRLLKRGLAVPHDGGTKTHKWCQ